MASSPVIAMLQMSRIPSSVVAFLTIFLPTYAHSRDLVHSAALAIPMVTIALCTFILNDLNDLERDRVNHPRRPLPSGRISPRSAAIIYMIAFITSLAMIRILTNTSLHFVYLTGFILAINYNTVVDYLPKFKTFYVAATSMLPIVLVTQIVGSPLQPALLSATFLFITGRETLMDVQDIEGDGATIARWFSPQTGTRVAFGLTGLGVFVLLFAVNTTLDSLAYSVIVVLFSVIILKWRVSRLRPLLLEVMKLQMLLGIAFLI